MKINKQSILNYVGEQQTRLEEFPNLKSGNTVQIDFKITENGKSRIQKIKGTIIRVRGSGINKSIILLIDSYGVKTELRMMVNNPSIVKIKELTIGKVRRNYISYMRNRSGKSARIKSGYKPTKVASK